MSIRDWFGRHAVALVVAGGLLASGGTAKAQLFPIQLPFPLPSAVSTDKGSLIGQSKNGIRQYLGIPYAAPPTGTRRWKAPAPESSYFLRDASRFAKHCAQPASQFGQASTDEDCLYLNVYSPASSLNLTFQPAPVMVWFHGGFFQKGETDDYDPTELVKRGVVVVTVNYRLGALGFMAHPALTAESGKNASGNYGLMDQQAALRWVQRNIRSFDGNPNNVTVVGQGAGGVSVYAHLASPGSAGLFHRAISMSGAYVGYFPQPTLATAEAEGQAIATAVGCAQQSLACLRAVPVSTLLTKQNSNNLYVPPVDGAVLPEGLLSAFEQGHFNRVPVVHGTTNEEFALFAALREVDGFPTTDAASLYANGQALLNIDPDSPRAAFWTQWAGTYLFRLRGAGTGVAFTCRAITLSHHLAKYVPVWLYQFTEQASPQDILPEHSDNPNFYQTYHGADVQYLLDSPDGPAPFTDGPDGQKRAAEHMKNYWSQFARTGNPNGTSSPAWPQYQDISDEYSTLPPILMELQYAPVPLTRWYQRNLHKCGRFGDDLTWSFDNWHGEITPPTTP